LQQHTVAAAVVIIMLVLSVKQPMVDQVVAQVVQEPQRPTLVSHCLDKAVVVELGQARALVLLLVEVVEVLAAQVALLQLLQAAQVELVSLIQYLGPPWDNL
jgi:hypothetical protein